MSDHFFGEGGLPDDQLYMTVPEQRDALLNAGFTEVRNVAAALTLVLHRATQHALAADDGLVRRRG